MKGFTNAAKGVILTLLALVTLSCSTQSNNTSTTATTKASPAGTKSSCGSPLPAGFPTSIPLPPNYVCYYDALNKDEQTPNYYAVYLAVPGPVPQAANNYFKQLTSAGFTGSESSTTNPNIAITARTSKIILTINIKVATGPLQGYVFTPGQVDMMLSASITS